MQKIKKFVKNINSYIFLIFLIIILFLNFEKKIFRPDPTRSTFGPDPSTRPKNIITIARNIERFIKY
jgi:predicted RND superfamily exporter protein